MLECPEEVNRDIEEFARECFARQGKRGLKEVGEQL